MHAAKLIVAVLVLSLAGAAAANASPAADAAFLQSLSQKAQEQPQEDALAGVGNPAPTNKSCSISRACGDGNTVACTGNYSCINSNKGVKCDTTEHPCPNYCIMTWQCPDTCPNYTFWCQSLKGDCGGTGDGCDGRPQRCLCPN